ncbi:MAG: cupin domain-containing protein [Alphaproteobacteria bacterium]|nr:cupin domain-containing protein [Alphaproteobacteria bacterium]
MATKLKISNWAQELSHAVADEAVGISLSPLAGNDQFTSYVVDLKPGAHVTPHYHPTGIEIYQILSGQGVMKTGTVAPGKDIIWDQIVDVKGGDFFTIDPGIVHELENNSADRLILIVTCSPSHLEKNRVVTA